MEVDHHGDGDDDGFGSSMLLHHAPSCRHFSFRVNESIHPDQQNCAGDALKRSKYVIGDGRMFFIARYL